MAQQPNIQLSPGDRPRPVLEPAPPRRQSPPRPGIIAVPGDMPRGSGFGTPGPNTGWALRIIAQAVIPDRTPALERVLAALMGARAARFGRAPTAGDLDVAMELVGLGGSASPERERRRQRWVQAVAHEGSPGRTAVTEAGDDLYS